MKVKRVIPEWKHPVATERRYVSLLAAATAEYLREVKASLDTLEIDTSIRVDESEHDLTARADGIIDDLAVMFAHFKAVATATFAGPIATLPTLFARVSMFNDKQWRRVIKVGTGFNFPASRDVESASGLGINAYRHEPWLDDLQSAWVSDNTDLIKSIPARFDEKIRQLVKSAVVNGTSAKTLADQIREVYGVTKNRAELIAIDQIQKANAALTMHRQLDVGVESYIWRGVLDVRERASHVEREGKRFRWDTPPRDGHPGQPVRCRCTAEPDFSGSIFDIGDNDDD